MEELIKEKFAIKLLEFEMSSEKSTEIAKFKNTNPEYIKLKKSRENIQHSLDTKKYFPPTKRYDKNMVKDIDAKMQDLVLRNFYSQYYKK